MQHSKAIKNALKNQGRSQMSLVKKLGLNQGNLSSFLNDRRTLPLEQIEQIMNELNIMLTINK